MRFGDWNLLDTLLINLGKARIPVFLDFTVSEIFPQVQRYLCQSPTEPQEVLICSGTFLLNYGEKANSKTLDNYTISPAEEYLGGCKFNIKPPGEYFGTRPFLFTTTLPPLFCNTYILVGKVIL